MTLFLCSLKGFIVSFDRAYKEVSTKNIEIVLKFSVCDMTVPSKSSELIRTLCVRCMNFRSISLLIAEK